MREWLDLSLKSEIPVSLLVLSRAFSSAMRVGDDSLKVPCLLHRSDSITVAHLTPLRLLQDTLQHLPAAVVDDAKAQVRFNHAAAHTC